MLVLLRSAAGVVLLEGLRISCLQISAQRPAWPLLLLDWRPISSGVEHWTKIMRAFSLAAVGEAGQGKSDSGRGREASETAVLRLLS